MVKHINTLKALFTVIACLRFRRLGYKLYCFICSKKWQKSMSPAESFYFQHPRQCQWLAGPVGLKTIDSTCMSTRTEEFTTGSLLRGHVCISRITLWVGLVLTKSNAAQPLFALTPSFFLSLHFSSVAYKAVVEREREVKSMTLVLSLFNKHFPHCNFQYCII